MIIETKSKKVTLVYRTRKIVKITSLLKGKNFEELYFKAFSESDIDALSKVIMIFAEDENTGLPAFESSENVYDFMDDYMSEKEKTYQDIFAEIAEDINKMGFFRTKMTEEVLKAKMENYMVLDINKIVEASAKEALKNVVGQELSISKA